MTSYKVLEDGSRRYSSGQRYMPIAPEDRIYKVRKPDSPTAFFWRGEWHEPYEFLPDDARAPMPNTRGFDDTNQRRKKFFRSS